MKTHVQHLVRFIQHEARTSTIRQWTGLTDDRIRKLFRSYVVEDARVRVTITHKPFFLTWDNVQRWLEDSIRHSTRHPAEKEADGGAALIGEGAAPHAD